MHIIRLARPSVELVEKQCEADYQVGQVMEMSSLPYLGKVADCRSEEVEGQVYLVLDFEPATMQEFNHAYQEGMAAHLGHVIGKEGVSAYDAAVYVADRLKQEAWLSGVPEDATIHCDVCEKTKPAHGANHYDQYLFCNECVRRWEESVVRGNAPSIEAHVMQSSAHVRLSMFIDKVERDGEGNWPLPNGKHADVLALYQRIDDDPEGLAEPHWPAGYMPTAYRIYLRRGSGPFNVPVAEIIATSRGRLFALLNGEYPLPSGVSFPHGRTLTGLCEQFGINYNTIVKAADDGRIRAWKDGKVWMSTERALIDAIEMGLMRESSIEQSESLRSILDQAYRDEREDDLP